MPETITTPVSSTAWNGFDLLHAFDFATRWLDYHRERINALNVFPIPDGDTGTNMALTMHAAVDGARTAPDAASAGSVAGKLAYGALMGARGNSGVILSQIFRGFAAGVEAHDEITGEVLARALDDARRMAYKAVMQPVEGTMLSVIRVAAEAASAASLESRDFMPVLQASLDGARKALAETPEQLDILRQAGVVDAGGQGIVRILEGLHRYAHGQTDIDAGEDTAPTGAAMHFLDDLGDVHGEDPFGYCTNFMIFGTALDFDHVRDTIAGMGQSAVIVGDDSVVKVHIHTEHPGAVLEYALSLGYLDQIKIDNMSLQTEALAGQREQAKSIAGESGSPVVDGPIGVIAVAAGEGLATALKSMGAHIVVAGGQTMNPSTEQLLEAANLMPVDEVIILPNNKNIILAASQVDALTGKSVHVIPSRSVPQGLAALASFTRDASLATNLDRMNAALDHVHTIEVTRSVRDVELNGVNVTKGDLLALVDGDLSASGSDLVEIVSTALHSLDAIEPELMTIFTGEDATPDTTSAMEDAISNAFPDADVEILEGGQPHYLYLISVE